MLHRYPVITPDGRLVIKSFDGPIGLLDVQSVLGGRVDSFTIAGGYVGFVNADAGRLGLPQNSKFPSFSGSVFIAKRDSAGVLTSLTANQHRQINVWVRDSLPSNS